jgi:hypothetical protein
MPWRCAVVADDADAEEEEEGELLMAAMPCVVAMGP